ncbi:MAG: threonine--tRNA ligase [Candidatus Methanospirare jalkutatii]|nr:threonine--tRNA ligase [Candidatus Methanospirare jalkutatii]
MGRKKDGEKEEKGKRKRRKRVKGEEEEMQLLFIHADILEFEAKRKTRFAEPLAASAEVGVGEVSGGSSGVSGKGRAENALVIFTAVERGDAADAEFVLAEAVKETRSILEKVQAESVVVYPYAHLSNELATADESIEILRKFETALREALRCPVLRAPFGWYKAFTLKCKGHPLSELSRRIRPSGAVASSSSGSGVAVASEDVGVAAAEVEVEGERKSAALEAEEKVASHFFILTPSGEEIPPEDFDFEGRENLWKFYIYEKAKRREVERAPPHVELMRRLEIADYEPASDPGNLRFYPKGKLMKSLLEDFVRSAVEEFGASEVETPLMYDIMHPTLSEYLNRFPARQYEIVGKHGKPELFLRFAACFGQFLLAKDASISYRNLPLRLFELAASFRKEKRGELVGLRRLRKFTMPDMHTFCKSEEEAIEEFKRQFGLCMRVLEGIGFSKEDYEVAIRFTRDFYEAHRDFIQELVRMAGKPVLAEMWEERFFYFVLKFEFNFVDATGKASALSTVQIDVENAQRYGIKYVDASGEEKHPIILHCSPSGAIERCIYALLERAFLKMERGNALPMLPVWLSPTQVRIIPVATRHLPHASQVLNALKNAGIRADLDDREESVSRKIRDAGREWIPFVAVVGDKEVESGKLSVTIREESTKENAKIVEMSVSELKERVLLAIRGKPFRNLPIPEKLSERPKFVGSA